jgi:hypothetical protein
MRKLTNALDGRDLCVSRRCFFFFFTTIPALRGLRNPLPYARTADRSAGAVKYVFEVGQIEAKQFHRQYALLVGGPEFSHEDLKSDNRKRLVLRRGEKSAVADGYGRRRGACRRRPELNWHRKTRSPHEDPALGAGGTLP